MATIDEWYKRAEKRHGGDMVHDILKDWRAEKVKLEASRGPSDELEYGMWAQWDIMENIQDASPHFWFGWDGFVAFVLWC